MFRRAFTVGSLLVALAAGACAGPAPSAVDPARAIHVQSWIDQAVVVEVSQRGGDVEAYTTALRPCGGAAVLVPGLSGVPASDLLISLLVDPTRILDAQLAEFTGDPHDLPGTFNGLSILWSTGEIQTPTLPTWITVTPEVVVVERAPPTVGSTCGPLLQQG